MPLKFALVAPYVSTPDVQALRLRLIEAHKAGIQKHLSSGTIRMAGPMLDDKGAGEGAADRAYGGSFFLLEAESYAAALEVVKADTYYTGGLWDAEKLGLFEYHTVTGYPF
ncbi:hypothetical protein C8J57DRAFT_1267650 [Mycena rebaudengoi]|nr:hypothetical protein C8J57DRAFT_1267650 [Mycena rebaudengoi]